MIDYLIFDQIENFRLQNICNLKFMNILSFMDFSGIFMEFFKSLELF